MVRDTAREKANELLGRDTADGVRPAAIGSLTVFALLAATQEWVGVPGMTPGLTVTFVLVALYSALVVVYLRRHPATAASAHPILLSLAIAMSLHHAIHLYVLANPAYTINAVLVALACAYFFSSRAWFAAAIAVCVLGWLPAALAAGPFVGPWRYWTEILGTGMVLAGVAFEAKRRTMLRLEVLRLESDAARTAAEDALARAEAANAERVVMENRMHEAQRRESLGMLAGGIAHDFNNLLMIVLGNVELARRGGAVSPEQEERLGAIESAASRATALANQMLAYAGKASSSVASVSLGERVRATTELFRSVLRPNVELELHEAEELRIEADDAMLDQVLVNLLKNAIDACEERGGRVDVRWGRCPASTPDAGHPFIEVEDSGCGMDAETRQRAFDPFFSTKPDGTGLGLAAVRGIAESHGARVSLKSEPDRGTVLRFVLPLSTACTESEEASSERAESPHLSNPVLVVDDQAEVRGVARAFLEEEGYAVTEASSGREALTRLQEGEAVGALLIDLTMPGMSGYELARAVRNRDASLPIVIMSGFDRTDRSTSPEEVHGLPFLQKPFRQSQLLACLASAVGGVPSSPARQR